MEEVQVRNIAGIVASNKDDLARITHEIATAFPELSDHPASPKQVLEMARPTIDKWIKDAIAEALPSVLKSSQTPLAAATAEILRNQEQQVHDWLAAYISKELPKLIEDGTIQVSEPVLKTIQETRKSAKEVNTFISTFNMPNSLSTRWKAEYPRAKNNTSSF